MSNFQKVTNDYTGQEELIFNADLVSISDSVLENVNGTEYRVASVRFQNPNGETVTRSAIVYEKNYQYGMSVGNSYQCTAINGSQGVLIRMSHLEQAGRATKNDFGDLFSTETKTTEAPAQKRVEGSVI